MPDILGLPTVGEILASVQQAAEYEKTSRVKHVRMTLCSLVVCAPKDMTSDEVEAEANKINISGTSRGWMMREADNPVRCDEDETKQHWILDA